MYRLTAMFAVKNKVACEAGLNSFNDFMLLATTTITIKIKKDCFFCCYCCMGSRNRQVMRGSGIDTYAKLLLSVTERPLNVELMLNVNRIKGRLLLHVTTFSPKSHMLCKFRS